MNVIFIVDEVYTFGRTNEVVVGYDDAMNYAICRFKIYIKCKYASLCHWKRNLMCARPSCWHTCDNVIPSKFEICHFSAGDSVWKLEVFYRHFFFLFCRVTGQICVKLVENLALSLYPWEKCWILYCNSWNDPLDGLTLEHFNNFIY